MAVTGSADKIFRIEVPAAQPPWVSFLPSHLFQLADSADSVRFLYLTVAAFSRTLFCFLTDLNCYHHLRVYSTIWHPFSFVSIDKRFFISCLLIYVLEGWNPLMKLIFCILFWRSSPQVTGNPWSNQEPFLGKEQPSSAAQNRGLWVGQFHLKEEVGCGGEFVDILSSTGVPLGAISHF